jgi:hypothetical protein
VKRKQLKDLVEGRYGYVDGNLNVTHLFRKVEEEEEGDKTIVTSDTYNGAYAIKIYPDDVVTIADRHIEISGNFGVIKIELLYSSCANAIN